MKIWKDATSIFLKNTWIVQKLLSCTTAQLLEYIAVQSRIWSQSSQFLWCQSTLMKLSVLHQIFRQIFQFFISMVYNLFWHSVRKIAREVISALACTMDHYPDDIDWGRCSSTCSMLVCVSRPTKLFICTEIYECAAFLIWY